MLINDYCELLVFRQTKKRVDPATTGNGISILYSGGNVRIMKLHDIGAAPDHGRDVIRVDIFDSESA